MVRNLLALLVALQEAELNDSQRYSLRGLSNTCANYLGKRISPDGWQNIQAKLTAILVESPELARRYQVVNSQLQLMNEEELMTLLPSLELRQRFQSAGVKTLGQPPAHLRHEWSQELENIVVEVATIILKSNKVVEMAHRLLPAADTVVKPEHSSKQTG